MKTKILSVSRLGVNALRLSTNRGPRLLVTSRNEIPLHEEKTLRAWSEQVGFRNACAGIGRVLIPAS